MTAPRIEALFDEHATDVLAFARRRTDPATADDVVAAVFAIAWRRIDRIPDDEPLLWLYGVARRVLANERRAQRRRAALRAVLHAGVPRAVAPDEDQAPVLAALAALTPADREVLMLTAWEGLSGAEAGVVLGCSAAAVHTRLHRARARLRSELGRPDDVAMTDHCEVPVP